MLEQFDKKVNDEIFKAFAKNVEVFLRSSKAKGVNYDKFRDTGYTQTTQNPYFIKAMTKVVSPTSLIYKELGLTKTGAMQIIVKNSDVAFIELSKRILINKIEYYIFDDAVGSKFQIFPLGLDYSKIIIFKKDI